MQLNILPGGDVADGVGIFLRQLRQHDHLLRVQSAKRDLDPLHARRIPERIRPLGERRIRNLLRLNPVMPLAVIIPLPIRPPAKPGLGKHLLLNLILLAKRDLRFKEVDLLRESRRDAITKLFFPCSGVHMFLIESMAY